MIISRIFLLIPYLIAYGDDSCFDCHLSQYSCLNWASCSDVNGLCICPPGFTGKNCGEIRNYSIKIIECGSLARNDRPMRPRDQNHCECDDGWTGINCNSFS